MGWVSFSEDNNEAERSFPLLETGELNDPPKRRKDGTLRPWTAEQRRRLKKVRDRAVKLGVIEIIKPIWDRASIVYSSPRVSADESVSFWEKHPTATSKSGSSIYYGVFYMGCENANKEMKLANHVFVSLSPKNLHLFTTKEEDECYDFLLRLSHELGTELLDWIGLRGWHVIALEQVAQASIFLDRLNRFLGVESSVSNLLDAESQFRGTPFL